MSGKLVGRPGEDLHTWRPGCIPAASALLRRTNAPLYVKPSTLPCAGHGVAYPGGITRLGYLMTYWVVEGVEGERGGPYPTRMDAERALSAVPR